MKKEALATLLLSAVTSTSQAALLGSELSLETIYQSTSSSQVYTIGYLTIATVTEPGVEFTSLQALETSGSTLYDVSINVGDDFIEIDFDNTQPYSRFGSALMNGYVLTFDSAVAVNFTDAIIDTSVTTLGLAESDVTFLGNQLMINVEGLSFNTSTFARINLSTEGGVSAVPVPAAFWLFGSGLIALAGIRRSKK